MSHTLGGQLATDAPAMAICQRGAPKLVHSDRGSTYATSLYLDLTRKYGIRQSMSRGYRESLRAPALVASTIKDSTSLKRCS